MFQTQHLSLEEEEPALFVHSHLIFRFFLLVVGRHDRDI
jgi:hypothetical protein